MPQVTPLLVVPVISMLRIRDEYGQLLAVMPKLAPPILTTSGSLAVADPPPSPTLKPYVRPHLLKHFKDHKTRDGQYRTDQPPEPCSVKMRGGHLS